MDKLGTHVDDTLAQVHMPWTTLWKQLEPLAPLHAADLRKRIPHPVEEKYSAPGSVHLSAIWRMPAARRLPCLDRRSRRVIHTAMHR